MSWFRNWLTRIALAGGIFDSIYSPKIIIQKWFNDLALSRRFQPYSSPTKSYSSLTQQSVNPSRPVNIPKSQAHPHWQWSWLSQKMTTQSWWGSPSWGEWAQSDLIIFMCRHRRGNSTMTGRLWRRLGWSRWSISTKAMVKWFRQLILWISSTTKTGLNHWWWAESLSTSWD